MAHASNDHVTVASSDP